MHTAETRAFISNNSLPSGCVLPKLKSLMIEQATRGAGSTLYEILGMAELMRVAYEKGELESLQQRLTLLLSDAADLSTTLSSILELSRLEAGTSGPAFREFDVVALLHEVALKARVLIGNRPVTVMDAASPRPLTVLSDPYKVRQIMTELTNNAVKFTDRGRIALIVDKDGDRLRLLVTDTGRGMSSEETGLFFQSDDREFSGDPSSGLGRKLGLIFVKRLVRSLGGTVSASSKPGEGSIVEVVLPLTMNAQKTPSPKGPGRLVQDGTMMDLHD